jgi:hypothetical protein
MRKLVLRGLSHPWLLELKPGSTRIGRSPASDFCIDETSISSIHCELTVDDQSIVVKDCGSTNGTFINDVAIREAVLLPGQTLRLGTAELRLDFESETNVDARVAIPSITIEQPRTHDVLADGVAACLNHSEMPATFRCTKCSETFCDDCIHKVGLEGGKPMRFCPVCSGECEPLAPLRRMAGRGKKRSTKSMFGRLTETLRLPFRHRQDDQ